MPNLIKTPIIIIMIIFICLLTHLKASNEAYNVINYGAKPDGESDSSKPFLRAWSLACNSINPSILYVPSGNFMIKPVVFGGPCNSRITFQIDGNLVGPSNYWEMGYSGYWILFYKVSKVSVLGGTIDAKGAPFWACRIAGERCPPGARSISFLWSDNVVVRGLTSMNSQIIHIALDNCNNCMIENVKITAPSWSPNTDGIHVESSSGVTISNNYIMTGDDCISIGPGSRNLWIERISCGPGHGISIGSLGNFANEDGVENVTVTLATIIKTQNGVRIKTWARPIHSFARNIIFENILMREVYNPIIIDQNYCPEPDNCPHQTSGVKIQGVTYKNIKGTSSTQIAVRFDCSPSNPCSEITLQDINLSFYNQSSSSSATTAAFCKNSEGTSLGVVVPRSCL